MAKSQVSVAEAAFRLKVSYLAARDLLLRGELAGGKEEFSGRLFVDESSLEDLVSKGWEPPRRRVATGE